MVTGLPPLAATPPPPDEEGGEIKARAETCKTRLDAEDIVFGVLCMLVALKESSTPRTEGRGRSKQTHQNVTVVVASKCDLVTQSFWHLKNVESYLMLFIISNSYSNDIHKCACKPS